MDSNSFLDTISNYRRQQFYLFLVESEFADTLLDIDCSLELNKICLSFGWDISFGTRFINYMVSIGFLIDDNERLLPADSLIKYFSKKSKYYQGYNIKFENYLQESWKTLPEVLTQGRRIFSTDIKDHFRYKSELELYIKAMDNVASIRADELFRYIEVKESGCFVDIAGGSGTFTFEFLNKHKQWNSIYLDTPDVATLSQILLEDKIAKGFYDKIIRDRIVFRNSNILEDLPTDNIAADCILLSNIIHCYDEETMMKIISLSKKILKSGGVVIVHDFFKDNDLGALYDIHMMINTYNGRTYFKDELNRMMEDNEFILIKSGDLQSQSSYMIFTQKIEN